MKTLATPDKPPRKRGSAYPSPKTAKELLDEQQEAAPPLANHQAPIQPTVTTALNVAENGQYAILGFHPEICIVKRSRRLQVRDFEPENNEIILGGRVDPSIRLDEIIPVLEADLDVQLDVWEKKKRGYIAWRRLLKARQEG